MENQRLQEELKTYKKEKLKLRTTTNLYPGAQTIPEETEAPPEYREFEGINRFQTDSMASSLADSIAGDMDPETMERAALTDSVNIPKSKFPSLYRRFAFFQLIQMAQAESNCLRRELLRSRLRRTVKGERPTSTDV